MKFICGLKSARSLSQASPRRARKQKEYIKEKFGYDAYYNPKELKTAEIVSEFNNVVEFIKESNLMKHAKSGWKYFKEG